MSFKPDLPVVQCHVPALLPYQYNVIAVDIYCGCSSYRTDNTKYYTRALQAAAGRAGEGLRALLRAATSGVWKGSILVGLVRA